MHNRLDILRIAPAPLGTPMFVYEHGSTNKINIYIDRACTKLMSQPIKMMTSNIHFYCKETVRVDIKIISEIYNNGYLLIEDQLMVNQDTYLDRIMTFNDTSLVVDSDGNMMSAEI